ncbi:MAG: hypothetical protein WD470_03910 [Rhodospirillaceae bacterium]
MIRILRLLGCLAAGAMILTACETTVQKPVYPQISFAHLPKIPIDVARVEVENRYVPPAMHPNVEHLFPVSPSASALNWGRDRLKPEGMDGVARVILRRASVVEVPLKRTAGVRSVFTTDQAERYDATMEMAVELRDENGNVRATIESTAKRSRSVPENVSLNDRDKIWFEMTEALMADLNQSLEGQLRQHMSNWVR